MFPAKFDSLFRETCTHQHVSVPPLSYTIQRFASLPQQTHSLKVKDTLMLAANSLRIISHKSRQMLWCAVPSFLLASPLPQSPLSLLSMTTSNDPRRSARVCTSRAPPSASLDSDSPQASPAPSKRRRVATTSKKQAPSEKNPQALKSPPAKKKKSSPAKKPKSAPSTAEPVEIYPPQHADIPFSLSDNSSSTLRLVTWNVASLRSVARSGALNSYMEREKPHILCLQETKMTPEAVAGFDGVPGYTPHWFHSDRKGYSGVAAFIRNDLPHSFKTMQVTRGMSDPTADSEGRVLTLFLPNSICLVNAYVPNAGSKLVRLDYRTTVFEPAMRTYLASLAEKHSVIYCGDLNVAYQPLDIHNSKGNAKSAGHTPQEREQFGVLLDHTPGWVDCYRALYPPYSGYTFYSRRFGTRLREQGKGWRLDYFIVDQQTFDKSIVSNCFVRPDVDGSDHYPLILDIKMPSEIDNNDQDP